MRIALSLLFAALLFNVMLAVPAVRSKKTLQKSSTPSDSMDGTAPQSFTSLTKSVRRRSKKQSKSNRCEPISLREMNGIINQQIEVLERARRQCPNGYYFNFGLLSCEPCFKCVSETNLSRCGFECRAFFHENHIKDSIQDKNILMYVVIGLFIFLLAITSFLTYKYVDMGNKFDELRLCVQEMEDRNRAAPTCDEKADDGVPVQATEETVLVEPDQGE